MTPRLRPRALLRRLGRAAPAAGIAVLLALPVVEVGVRLLGLAPDVKLIEVTKEDSVYKRSTNPILGFELKANWRDPQADLVTSYPSTNSHGQRDVERTRERPPGVRRVVVLGASVVEGFGIRDLDDTITRRLEALYDEVPTEVLNFGVSAYCTRAKVELLRTKALAFEPDVVVLFFTQNDFHNFNHEAFALGSPVRRPPLVERLFLLSHAFRVLCTRANLFYFGAQLDPISWNRRAIGDNNVVDGLELLAELAEREGFDPLIAIWPRFTDEAIVDMHPMPGGSGELVVERLAREVGLPTFRLSRYFEEAARELARRRGEPVNPRRTFTPGDFLHPNPLGCRVAAAALRRELEPIWAAREKRGRWVPPPARGRPDEAALAAARALGRAEPHRSRIVVNLGNTLLSQGRLEEAIEQYRRALEIKPDLAEAHVNWGVALKRKGDLAGALSQYQAALAIDPDLPDAHYNLGIALAALGRPEEARAALRRALALRADFAAARRALEILERQAEAPPGGG